jgi:hypothetical protein
MTAPSTRCLALLAPLLLSAAACTDLQSADITTSGISATMTVTADGTGNATASVQLNVDTSATDYVTLSPGDTLTASFDRQSELMAEDDSLFNEVTYTAAFASGGAEGASYTIALQRRGGLSAPESTCTIPAPFDVIAPSGSASFSRSGAPVVIQYAPSGGSDPISWSVSATCESRDIDTFSTTLSGDPGSFAIPASALQAPSGNGSQGNCHVTVTIDRTRSGSLDPAYDQGTIAGVQERTLTFTSTP